MPSPPCSNFGRRGWSPNGGIVNLDRSPSTPYGGRAFEHPRDTCEDDCDQGFSMIPSADMRPPRRPQPNYNIRDLCNDLDQNSSSPQIGRPLNPYTDLTPQNRAVGFQQRRQPPSEVKLSSAGRAFNSGDNCCDNMFQTTGDCSGPDGRPINPMEFFHGYVEPGSPQWVSLYMHRNIAAREGFCSPNDMQNRSPSSNRYDCDPCPDQSRNANCDPNANQQIYRNQNFGNQGQNVCPCIQRPGANPNQPRQMQPWNQPDCSPPRMMPPNFGQSPQYNMRDNSPKRPCPPCGGAGVPSNVNISRGSPNPCSTLPSIQAYNPAEVSFNQNASPLQMNQTFASSSQPCPPNPCPPKPCPPPPQPNCCPLPMPQQQQQKQQQQQQQQQRARWNSPDCSPNRAGRQRSNASFKPSDFGPKAASTPKPTASNLSMRELCNRKLRELQLENLVRDQYTPGIIQETLDGCENFNCVSFDLTLGQDAPNTKPQVDPLTLVEAFALRIDFERKQLNCAKERNAKGKEKETDPEKLKKNEKKEIEKYFACQNDSELNRAIAGLLRAERIEELTSDVKPLFTTEMSKKESTLPGSDLNNFQDLTMITYTSTTKPA